MKQRDQEKRLLTEKVTELEDKVRYGESFEFIRKILILCSFLFLSEPRDNL